MGLGSLHTEEKTLKITLHTHREEDVGGLGKKTAIYKPVREAPAESNLTAP